MDGWMDGSKEGRKNVLLGGWMERWIDGWMEKWVDEWIDGRMDRWQDVRTDGLLDKFL